MFISTSTDYRIYLCVMEIHETQNRSPMQTPVTARREVVHDPDRLGASESSLTIGPEVTKAYLADTLELEDLREPSWMVHISQFRGADKSLKEESGKTGISQT
jgi:hypothetical protein